MSADPAGLLLPVPEQEEDLTRQWLDRRFRQVRPARPASAVVLVRDGDDGPEVFLRHRAGRTPLGRVGLPGGALIESDADSCPWYGPEPSQWAHTFGTTDRRRARQHVVAAVRQLHDEAGVLLAGRSDTDVVSTARVETWGGGRSSLEEGSESLPHLLAARGLGLRADLLRPVMRWHSAPHVHRRFDTAVFATTTPPVQSEAARG
ncbi:MAG TPA: NUDIX hydrolase, partial [Micrococcus luteus]|nr:NUDIX hydrolase [Micrococcus luteus]